MSARERGDCSAAILELQRSLEHAPKNGTAWYHLGLCRSNLGDEEKAKVAFAEAVKDPELPPALRADAESRTGAADLSPTASPETTPAVTPSPPKKKKKSVGKAWWLWTSVGLVLAAGAATAVTLVFVLNSPVNRARRDADIFIDARSL